MTTRLTIASALTAVLLLAAGCAAAPSREPAASASRVATEPPPSSAASVPSGTKTASDGVSAYGVHPHDTGLQWYEWGGFTRQPTLDAASESLGFRPHVPTSPSLGQALAYYTKMDVSAHPRGQFIALYRGDVELQVIDWAGEFDNAPQWERKWRSSYSADADITEADFGNVHALAMDRQGKSYRDQKTGAYTGGWSVDGSGVTWWGWDDGLTYTLGTPGDSADPLLALVPTMR